MNDGEILVRAILTAGLLSVTASAHADEPDPQPDAAGASEGSSAAAQALFVDGRHLVAAGRYEEGCAKLEQSNKLDPAPGTRLNLADCYEKAGKVATAWLAFHEAASLAQRSGRAEWATRATERARVLEPRVPLLTIVVEDPTPGLELRRDGVLIDASTLGSPVPLDPATYSIAAESSGRRPWTTRVIVEASTRVVLHVPRLVADTRLRPQTDALVGTAVARAVRFPQGAGELRRIWAVAFGAAAVVTAGAGAYLGIIAASDNGKAGGLCPTASTCTDARALTLTDNANRSAEASTVAFVASGALAVAAATLFFTSPRAPVTPSVAVGFGAGSLSLYQRW